VNIQDCDRGCLEVQDGIITKTGDISFIPLNPILMITTTHKDHREDILLAISSILHSIMICEEQEIKAIIEIIMALPEIGMFIIIIMDQKPNQCHNTLHNRIEMLNMGVEERLCLHTKEEDRRRPYFIALR